MSRDDKADKQLRKAERALMTGDTIQIGQYMFQYSEKTKTGKAA